MDFTRDDLTDIPLDKLRESMVRLRGNPELPPEASVVVPVNAQRDLDTCLHLLGDLAQYCGNRRVELVLVVNNFDPDAPPGRIGQYREAGIRVVAVPEVGIGSTAPQVENWRRHCRILRARQIGAEAAESEVTIHLDGDCRIVDATALLDWYIRVLGSGYSLAYTHVGHHHVCRDASVRTRLAVHHFVRWAKRNVLRIPTVRGSNYAVRRCLFIDMGKTLFADIQLGTAVKAAGGRCRYGGGGRLAVLTSGAQFRPGWGKLFRYNWYRLRFNFSAIRGIPR